MATIDKNKFQFVERDDLPLRQLMRRLTPIEICIPSILQKRNPPF